MDDYVDCFETEEEAVKVLKKVIEIHSFAGFDLRNITSNSDRIKQMYGNYNANENAVSLNVEEVERVLGMFWAQSIDCLKFVLKLHKVPKAILNFERKPTKRETLSLNMSIFDPFGLLSNYMVSSKVLMQALWKCGIDWDDELPDHIYEKWKLWVIDLPKLETFSVPRCYDSKFLNAKLELHIFLDASEEAMATVAYWRIHTDEIKIILIAAKTSNVPTRFHSIPKFELQEAVMGVRLKA